MEADRSGGTCYPVILRGETHQSNRNARQCYGDRSPGSMGWLAEEGSEEEEGEGYREEEGADAAGTGVFVEFDG